MSTFSRAELQAFEILVQSEAKTGIFFKTPKEAGDYIIALAEEIRKQRPSGESKEVTE